MSIGYSEDPNKQVGWNFQLNAKKINQRLGGTKNLKKHKRTCTFIRNLSKRTEILIVFRLSSIA